MKKKKDGLSCVSSCVHSNYSECIAHCTFYLFMYELSSLSSLFAYIVVVVVVCLCVCVDVFSFFLALTLSCLCKLSLLFVGRLTMCNFVVNSILAVQLNIRCVFEMVLFGCFCIVRRFNFRCCSSSSCLLLLLLLLFVVQLERKSGQLKFPLKFLCLSKCSNLRKYMLKFCLNCGEHYEIQQINRFYFNYSLSLSLYLFSSANDSSSSANKCISSFRYKV